MNTLANNIDSIGHIDQQLVSIFTELVECGEISFSNSWYLQHFPSDFKLTLEPIRHYEKYGYLQGLSPHPLFDPNWYLRSNRDIQEAGVEPFAHFMEHGHLEGRSPHPFIDLKHIESQLVGIESTGKLLDHYLKYGYINDISPHPFVDMKWFKMHSKPDRLFDPLFYYFAAVDKKNIHLHPLIDLNHVSEQASSSAIEDDPLAALLSDVSGTLSPHPEYFDSRFYLSKNGDVKECGVHPLLHYLADGWKEGREPARHFRSKYSRFFEYGHNNGDQPNLVELLKSGDNLASISERFSYYQNVLTRLKVLSKEMDPASLVELIESYKLADPYSATEAKDVNAGFWPALSAYYLYKSGNIEAASQAISSISEEFSESPCAGMMNQILLTKSKKNSHGYFNIADNKSIVGGFKSEQKVAVYTALFGDFDRLQPILIKPDNVDFICFTDQDIKAPGWTIKPMERRGDNDNLEAKAYKVFPWEYLRDYDYSLFVDSNTLFTGNIGNLINRYLIGEEFSAWEHPERDNLVDESFAIFLGRKFEKGPIFSQLENYLHNHGLDYKGMIEASFLWRSHDSQAVKDLMTNWWEHISSFTSRDQLSITHLMNTTPGRPTILSPKLGSSRENAWFLKIPHQGSSQHRSFDGDVVNLNSKQAKAKARRKLVFVYHDTFRFSGATVMRCFQAADILDRAKGDKYDISLSAKLDISGSYVYLSKGALKKISIDEISALQSRGNIVFADFVDDPVRQELLPWIDALLASSVAAYADFVKRFPNNYVHHLVHMTDTRLPAISASKTLNIGYFGELSNTVITENISEQVDFIGVNTKVSNPAWLSRLPNYNCHYCVRQTRDIDAFKPFLKGFTAAHFEAPILVDRHVKEAQMYLGSDYPFISENGKEGAVLELLDFAKMAYNTPIWHDAVDRLRHLKNLSSSEHYVGEFQNLLDRY